MTKYFGATYRIGYIMNNSCIKMKCIYVLWAFVFCSCADTQITEDMRRLMGQQITLSSDWEAVWRGRDTVVTNFMETPIKLVVYHDSLVCTTCQLSRMNDWDEIAAYADSLDKWFRIIYLFAPKKGDWGRVKMALKSGRFDYPVFIDPQANFVRQNPNIPKDKRLHSFLLDKNNKVVLVGSPLHNPALWMLYKSTIQKMIDNNGTLSE